MFALLEILTLYHIILIDTEGVEKNPHAGYFHLHPVALSFDLKGVYVTVRSLPSTLPVPRTLCVLPSKPET